MMDHWEGQDYRVEVWIEKEALVGVIAIICERLDVDYFACKGYVSQSEMWSASERFNRYQESGQEVVIVHLGDHDPSGMDMTRDINDRQDLFSIDSAGISIERIALNMDQVKQYDPPPNPAKLTDTRSNGYINEYGYSSWELDALDPHILQDLIEDVVLMYRSQDIYKKVIKQQKKHLAVLERVAKNWETL